VGANGEGWFITKSGFQKRGLLEERVYKRGWGGGGNPHPFIPGVTKGNGEQRT